MSIFTRRSPAIDTRHSPSSSRTAWWLRTLALAGAAVSPDMALTLADWDAAAATNGTQAVAATRPARST
jgi:hypothetical protein